MSEYKYILDAQATLPNNEVVKGPITTSDDINFLFRNQVSSLDFYLVLKKDGQNRWHQVGGPEIQHPQSMVDEIGYQIDTFIIENPILNKHNLKNNT